MFAPNSSVITGRLLRTLAGPSDSTLEWEIAVEKAEAVGDLPNEAQDAVGKTIQVLLHKEKIAQSSAPPSAGDLVKLEIELRADAFSEIYAAVGNPPIKV
jgi:hypothetical protein